MCFSATASFAAAGVLGASGAVTLREAKNRSRVMIAAIPLIFGVQQAVEGIIWISSDLPQLQATAAYVYVFFSHVLWPFYVPLAVMMIEPPGRRRGIIKGFVLFGIATSLWLGLNAFSAPISAALTPYGVVYQVNTPGTSYSLAAYVFATCLVCFFSSHKFIRVFGLAVTGSLLLALWAYQLAFYSVWCFFSALLSFIVYVHLKHGDKIPAVHFHRIFRRP